MPRTTARRAPLAALMILLTPLAACTSGEEESAPAPDPGPTGPTALTDYDAAGLALPRASPCQALEQDAVARAVGGEVTGTTSWSDGKRARLAVGVRDVAQEAGCAFRGEGGATTARAWVFAPPVSPPRARDVVGAMRREAGCQELDDAPPLGRPGLARTCRRGDQVVASRGGLFGDAWLGCSVAVARSAARGADGRAALAERTDQWCVAVVESAR